MFVDSKMVERTLGQARMKNDSRTKLSNDQQDKEI